MPYTYKYLIFIISIMITLVQVAYSTPNTDHIKIGWTGPLSGNSAVVGVDILHAVQMVFDQVNSKGGIKGRKLKLISEDDRYDTNKTITAYSKLVHTDNVIAIIASTYGGVFATAKRAARDGVILIDPLDCNDDLAALPKTTFCIATQTESIAKNFVDDIKAKGFKSIAIIYENNDPWMAFIMKKSAAMLNAHPNTSVHSYATTNTCSDYKPILLKAKQRRTEALILLGNDQMGLAMRQTRSLGITAQFYTIGSMTSPTYQKLAGPAANGSLVSFWQAPRNQEHQDFIDMFKTRYKRTPLLELATIPSYDAAWLLVHSLEKAINDKGEFSREDLLAQLYTVKSYKGLSGTISIESDGAVRSIKEEMFIFKNGKLSKEISPNIDK